MQQIPYVHATNIENIRFGKPTPDTYRIVIETNIKTPFESFLLTAPYRLVVDIPSSSFIASDFKSIQNIPIKNYRAGIHENNITRIVFDLESSLEIASSFTITSPNRIVIDLKTSTTIKNIEKIVSIIPLPQRKPINNTYIIAIDAGHGGKDPGASNRNIREKHITLSLSKALKSELEKTGRYKVILTRPNDKFVKLRKRVDIARRAGADLFISLHADKLERKTVRGAAIYTLSEKASDKESAKLAKRENEADIIAGVDLSHEDDDVADILIDLAIRDTMNNSNIFANTILKSFKEHNLRLLKTAHRSAGFAVLKAPDIPSVLIEAGFLSNASEARLLSSKAHQKKIAKAITNSINKYFAKLESAALH